MPSRDRRLTGPVVLLVLALLAAGCSGGDGNGGGDQGGGGDGGDQGEIVVGASLPLTGERSETGQATKAGYEIWRDMVNEAGGILGREVRLVLNDDGGDLNRVRANYQALIDREGVDLLLGTYSGLLNEPASAVAEQRRMLFVCPACGSPNLIERNFHFFFFSQPAIAEHQADLFSDWVVSLPPDERPQTAAYPNLDDPFTKPVIDGIRQKLEAAGIQTVYAADPYPEGLGTLDPIAEDIKRSGAELVAHGALFADGVALARSMAKVDYNPQMFFQTVAPAVVEQYAEALGGAEHANGVFYATGWSADADYPLNQEFVERYRATLGEAPPEDAGTAFGAAQVVQAAVEGVGSIPEGDQTELADWLHEHTVDTIMGPLSWDERGAPEQTYLLAQWQGGEPQIVLPEDVATTDEIITTKPAWQ